MPLYPPPAAMPLDSSRGAALELPCTPDVLVLPSDLQPFAKLVTLQQQPGLAGCIAAKDTAAAGGPASSGMEGPAAERAEDSSVVCINPGRLAKGAAGEKGGWLGRWGRLLLALAPCRRGVRAVLVTVWAVLPALAGSDMNEENSSVLGGTATMVLALSWAACLF